MLNRLAVLAFCALVATTAGASIVAGGTATIDEPVAGNLYVAGGTVSVTAPVGGNAGIAGGNVDVSGKVKGNLRVAGGYVKLDGPVEGNATVSGGTLELGPNARIAGKLVFRGGHLEQDPAAQVVGGVVHTQRGKRSWGGGDRQVARGVVGWVWTAGLIVLAALIAGALPGATRRMETELRTRPGLAALTGVVALICIPVAAVLLMVTIIGIPLGLLGLFAYAALLLVGYVSTSVVVSGLLLDRFKAGARAMAGWRVGAAVLAMLVIALLARVPFVGGLVALTALVIGVGVIVAALAHRKQGSYSGLSATV